MIHSTDRWSAMLAGMAVIAALALLQAGCGGGGGGGGGLAGGGIGGTGVTSGTISGFGSVFVNGVEFETAGTSFDVDDDPAAVEGDLGIGMVVTVIGRVNDDGVSGTADSIVYDDVVEGPIAGNPVEDQDMITKTFDVLGTTVIVDRNTTVFENTGYDTLAQNDVVEISGYFNGNSELLATRLEKAGVLGAGTEVETRGTVSGFNAIDTFTLGSVTVTFDGGTVFEDLPGTVSNGQYVEVTGTLTNATTIAATRIELEDEGFDDDVGEISVEGIVSDFNSLADFRIAGQAVDASGAGVDFEPASLAASIADGDKLEVEGAIVGGVLIADSIEQRAGDIRISATVDSRNPAAGTVTLTIAGNMLTVTTTTRTRFEDERDDVDPFSLVDIASGDYLDIEAYLDDGGNLFATQIKRDEPDDIELQGPADVPPTGGTTNSGTISILGIALATGIDTEFEDAAENSISGGSFFGSVNDGDLVRFSDEQVPDGTADKVEFED